MVVTENGETTATYETNWEIIVSKIPNPFKRKRLTGADLLDPNKRKLFFSEGHDDTIKTAERDYCIQIEEETGEAEDCWFSIENENSSGIFIDLPTPTAKYKNYKCDDFLADVDVFSKLITKSFDAGQPIFATNTYYLELDVLSKTSIDFAIAFDLMDNALRCRGKI